MRPRIAFLAVLIPLLFSLVAAAATIELLGDYPLIYNANIGDYDAVRRNINRGAKVNRLHPDGTTALVEAGKGGYADVITLLLKHKAWTEYKDEDGKTALIYAAERGHAKAVYELIKGQADIEAYDKQGLTPLIVAARNNNPDVIRLLIGAGVDVNRSDFARHPRPRVGRAKPCRGNHGYSARGRRALERLIPPRLGINPSRRARAGAAHGGGRARRGGYPRIPPASRTRPTRMRAVRVMPAAFTLARMSARVPRMMASSGQLTLWATTAGQSAP